MKRLIAILGAGLLASTSSAQIIKRTFNFTAYNFVDPFGVVTPPVDPVIGSITVKWDRSNVVTDDPVGITLNSINILVDSPLVFDTLNPDFMEIGGSIFGASGAGYNDFILYFNDASTNPYGGFDYTQTGINTGFVTNTVTITATTDPVPEPASWAMMLGGFGLIGGALRTRRKTAVMFA
jgi:hypothetical protein